MTYDGWFTGSKRAKPAALATRPPPSPYAALWGAAASGGEGAPGEGEREGGGGGGDGYFSSPGREGGRGDAGHAVSYTGSGVVPRPAGEVYGRHLDHHHAQQPKQQQQHSFTLDSQHSLDMLYTCPKVHVPTSAASVR